MPGRLMIIFYTLIFSTFIICSCSEYQRILKGSDYDKKLEKAKEYYDKKDYARALSLLEELLSIFKGTSKAEEVYFLYSYCHYHQDNYILAGYYFQDFSRTFPNSKHCEEAEFMGAYCYYLDSPDFSLDQENTVKAIQELQLFINRHPESGRLKEANDLIDQLRYKLETKALYNSKLYYDMGDYKAAIISFKNALKDFPDTRYREEIMFLMLDASYLLATNSVTEKRIERFQVTIDNFHAFRNEFPSSKMMNKAEKIYSESKYQITVN
jgi:outer membrane protein assembly factor BamD